MTRSYFLDYVTDWDELIELCRDNDCDICEDIIDDDELDEYVESDIDNADRGWRAIRDYLDGIPTGYGYYRCDGSFDYVGMDDADFEDYKNSVLEWMDDRDLWEPEEDEEDEEYDEPYFADDDFAPGENVEPEEPAVEEEDFTVSALISMCGAELVTIQTAVEQRRKEEDEGVASLLSLV